MFKRVFCLFHSHSLQFKFNVYCYISLYWINIRIYCVHSIVLLHIYQWKQKLYQTIVKLNTVCVNVDWWAMMRKTVWIVCYICCWHSKTKIISSVFSFVWYSIAIIHTNTFSNIEWVWNGKFHCENSEFSAMDIETSSVVFANPTRTVVCIFCAFISERRKKKQIINTIYLLKFFVR